MAIIVVRRGIRTAEIQEEQLEAWKKQGYKYLHKRNEAAASKAAAKPAPKISPDTLEPEKSVGQDALTVALKDVVDAKIIKVLKDSEYTVKKLKSASKKELTDLPLIGKAAAKKILEAVA